MGRVKLLGELGRTPKDAVPRGRGCGGDRDSEGSKGRGRSQTARPRHAFEPDTEEDPGALRRADEQFWGVAAVRDLLQADRDLILGNSCNVLCNIVYILFMCIYIYTYVCIPM